MLRKLLYISLLIVFHNNIKVNAFNLSPVPNIILRAPQLETYMQPVRPSYFGYSLVLRENSILIAAPRAQSSLASQGAINETGEIYKCPLVTKSSVRSAPNCYPFVFDDAPNIKGVNYMKSAIKDFQWLGASMDGGPKETDNLIVCAPKFAAAYDIVGEMEYLHGVCYWSMNTLGDKPRLVKNSVINPMSQPDLQRKKNLYNTTILNYQLGEAGFSVHITPNNLEFLIGAPGIEYWKGSVVHFNKQTGQSNVLQLQSRSYSYAGYAVASGYLDSGDREKILYVVSLPHNNIAGRLGEVRIFDIGEKSTIILYASFQGLQYGEFFGYAVLVEDINGDGLDDVLVTAPQSSLDEEQDGGAVHVFLNKGLFNFRRQLIKSPFSCNGRFGTTISKLGDINLDGYKDIAVGAPFANDVGAVVIYLGGPNGLRESQILNLTFFRANDLVGTEMFGYGLSKGVDFDRNGYNDFAIGAPGIGHVFIYRAYPVVKIVASIKSTKPTIDMSDQELQLKVCYHIVTSSSIIKKQNLIMSVNVDSKIRRVTLVYSQSHQFKFVAVAGLENQCQTFEAAVKFVQRHVFTPIVMELTYQLRYDGSSNDMEEFCTNCTVVNPLSPKGARNVVTYKHGCKNTVCNVDLKFINSEMPEVVLLGNSSTMSTKFIIENAGEKAFDTQVTITTSLDLRVAKIPSYCVEHFDEKLKLICSLGQGQAFTGRTVLEVDFDVTSDQDVKSVMVKAVVSSTGNETQRYDNVIERGIEFYKYSAVEVIGEPTEGVIDLDKNKEGITEVSFTYEIHNIGPSCLSHPEFRFTVPVAFNDTKKKNFQFVDVSSMNLTVCLDGDNYPTLQFNVPKMQLFPLDPFENNQMQFYSLYQEHYNARKNMPDKRVYLLNCSSDGFVICAESHLTLPILETGRNLSLKLSYTIDRQSAIAFIGDSSVHYLGIMPDVFVRQITKLRSELNITKSLEPIIFVKTAHKTPLWIYIVSIIGGILLLVLLTMALIKMGFFKRQTKEDMEKLLLKKKEFTRMKTEIEDLVDDDGVSIEKAELDC